jgi:hypothetical protein
MFVVAFRASKMVDFLHENISPFWEVLSFVAETLYHKGCDVLNFHLSLQYEEKNKEDVNEKNISFNHGNFNGSIDAYVGMQDES